MSRRTFPKTLVSSQNLTSMVNISLAGSSDMVYFRLYGEFIVKSFEHTCSKEAALHISIVDGDDVEINALLNSGPTRTFFTNHKQKLSQNYGPIASLIRFISVSELLKFSKLPILVMDLGLRHFQSFNEDNIG